MNTSPFRRIVPALPLLLLVLWSAATYHRILTLAIKTHSQPLCISTQGSSVALAQRSIGIFPGPIFAHVDSGDNSGAHFTDELFDFAGFQFAYRPWGASPVTAFVLPVWPLWVLAMIPPIRAWRRSRRSPAAFPVSPPPVDV